MNNLSLNSGEVSKWFKDNGDLTHNLNYDLNEDSIVIDLGGYTGLWAQQIIDKYNSNIYIIEPLPNFYNIIISKFNTNQKVKVLNVGVSTENKKGKIYLNGDASSSNLVTSNSIDVNFDTIDNIMKEWGLTKIDLIQINIEGDEYLLLEYMLEKKLVTNFKNIQIQFHHGIQNDIERRNKIREGLLKEGFKIKFDYPFVWESWCQNM